MVSKCKICGQYRMHTNADGICDICLSSRQKDDLSIVVRGLEKMVERLQKDLTMTELKVEKQGRLIASLQATIRGMKK